MKPWKSWQRDFHFVDLSCCPAIWQESNQADIFDTGGEFRFAKTYHMSLIFLF